MQGYLPMRPTKSLDAIGLHLRNAYGRLKQWNSAARLAHAGSIKDLGAEFMFSRYHRWWHSTMRDFMWSSLRWRSVQLRHWAVRNHRETAELIQQLELFWSRRQWAERIKRLPCRIGGNEKEDKQCSDLFLSSAYVAFGGRTHHG